MPRWINNPLLACCVAVITACATAPAVDPATGELPRDYAAALDDLRTGEHERAIARLTKFTDKHPRLSAPWVNLAAAHCANGDLDAAETTARRAVKVGPDNPAAHNRLGIVLREKGQFADAEGAYLAALAAEPSYANATINLGVLYDLYLARPQAALELYRRYAELTGGEDKQVNAWIKDLERRTGATQRNAEIAEP